MDEHVQSAAGKHKSRPPGGPLEGPLIDANASSGWTVANTPAMRGAEDPAHEL